MPEINPKFIAFLRTCPFDSHVFNSESIPVLSYERLVGLESTVLGQIQLDCPSGNYKHHW